MGGQPPRSLIVSVSAETGAHQREMARAARTWRSYSSPAVGASGSDGAGSALEELGGVWPLSISRARTPSANLGWLHRVCALLHWGRSVCWPNYSFGKRALEEGFVV
jgi:hypothetical protein